jgi:hypothetical protein
MFLCYSDVSPLQVKNKPREEDMKHSLILGSLLLISLDVNNNNKITSKNGYLKIFNIFVSAFVIIFSNNLPLLCLLLFLSRLPAFPSRVMR